MSQAKSDMNVSREDFLGTIEEIQRICWNIDVVLADPVKGEI